MSQNRPASAQPIQLQYDIVINGGSFSSPAAALEAARADPQAKILLMEPTDWLGGQATSEGVAAIDNAWHNPGATLMRDYPTLYYPADYLQFLTRINDAPTTAPGYGYAGDGACWVSREAFDPRTAAWVLDNMIAEQPNITLMKMTVVKDVATSSVVDSNGNGRVITSLRVIQRTPVAGYKPSDNFLSQEIHDWYTTTTSAQFTKQEYEIVPHDSQKGLVVVDASELADVIVLSGAEYLVGRELTTEKIAEDGTLPAMDEEGSQSFVYPFCMEGTTSPTAELDLKTPWPDFDTYYQQQLNTYFSLSSYSWTSVWTYRRLKNAGAPYNSIANLGDITMQNWYPGNDYPYGSMYKDRADAAAEASNWMGGVNVDQLSQAEEHATAFYFYMKSYPTRALETRFLRGNDPDNMMGTGTGLAKFPYIRGTRRIIGLDNFRLLERYFVDTSAANYTGGPSFRYYDSLGIGNYAEDVHPTKISTGISVTISKPAPFYIPYRALGSVNVRNLIAAGKTIATTFLTNAAYRLHPIEWAIGSAAGGAAAAMAHDGKTNYDLLDIPTLRSLQNEVNQNSPISWAAYDATPIPTQDGDLIFNNNKTIQSGSFPVTLEIYHHLGVRAQVYLNGTLLSETTTKANGRLLFSIPTANAGDNAVVVKVYDGGGTLLDTLTGDMYVESPPTPYIIDDSDPGFTTQGSWTVASAQTDKYGTTYHYAYGSGPVVSATWNLYTPQPGIYAVFIWYPESSNRATDAPFTVNSADGSQTIHVNQQINGGQWVSLGQFRFSGPDTGTVVLTNQISNPAKLVVADAVKTELVSEVSDFWMIR